MVKVTKPRTGAKGKKTLDYESDDFSLSRDDSTPKATMGKPSIKELLEKIEEKDKIIRLLESELSKSKVTSRVDGRGDKLRQDGESLLLALAFSKIQVPQGWMEGNSAR